MVYDLPEPHTRCQVAKLSNDQATPRKIAKEPRKNNYVGFKAIDFVEYVFN